MKKHLIFALLACVMPWAGAQSATTTTGDSYVISSDRQAHELHQLTLLIDARLDNLLAAQNDQTLVYPEVNELFDRAVENRQNFFDHLFFTGMGNRLISTLMEWDTPWPIHYPLIASHASYYIFGEPLALFNSQNRIYSFNQVMLWVYQAQLENSDSIIDPMAILIRFMIEAKNQNWSSEELFHEFTQLFPLENKEPADLEQLTTWLDDIQPLIAASEELLPSMQTLVKDRRLNTFYQDIISQVETNRIEALIEAYQPTARTLFQMQFNQDALHFNNLVMQEFNARFEASGLDASLKEGEIAALDFIILSGFLRSLSGSVNEQYRYLHQFFGIRELVFIILEFEQETQEQLSALTKVMEQNNRA